MISRLEEGRDECLLWIELRRPAGMSRMGGKRTSGVLAVDEDDRGRRSFRRTGLFELARDLAN